MPFTHPPALPASEVFAILNGLPDPILFLGLDGCVVALNASASRLLGYDAEQIRGLPLDELLYRKSLGHLISQKLLSGRFKDYYTHFRSRSGQSISVSLSSTLVYDAQECLVGIALSARDFRDSDVLYRQVVQSAKMTAMGHMAAGIAHEINNPLTSLLGTCELLLEEAQTSASLLADIESMHSLGIRIRDVVRRLLSLARSHEEVTYDKVDLNALLGEAAGLLENELRVARVELRTEFQEELPVTLTDPHNLRQVFLNLLLNASKAMPDGGTITLRTSLRGDRLCAEVIDTGIGIPQENLERVFQPFFTTSEAGQGTGLGLALCQTILRSMGGEITASSRPGEGSSFVVRLPFLYPGAHDLAWKSLQSIGDRRSTSRVGEQLEVLIDGDSGAAVLTQDIGPGGIRIYHQNEFSLDTESTLSLRLLDDELFRVQARTAWQRYDERLGRYEVGFQFVRLSQAEQDRLSAYLTESVHRGAPLVGRRRFARVPRLLFVDIQKLEDTDESSSGVIVDLNRSGARIVSSRTFSVGSKLNLVVEFEEELLHSLPSIVRWSGLRMAATEDDHKHLIGVEFDNFCPVIESIVDSYLEERKVLREEDLLRGLTELIRPGEPQ